MKRLIYILLFLSVVSCSKDEDPTDPNLVNATINIYATSSIEYVRYTQLDKEDTTRVYTIEAPVVDGKCEIVDKFKKGFTSKVTVKLETVGEFNIVVTVDGKQTEDIFRYAQSNSSYVYELDF